MSHCTAPIVCSIRRILEFNMAVDDHQSLMDHVR